jgi:hypothetical protein
MRLPDAAARVGRSVRTLFRWQEQGLLRILPGGWVIEAELVAAEAMVRKRLLVKKYVRGENLT